MKYDIVETVFVVLASVGLLVSRSDAFAGVVTFGSSSCGIGSLSRYRPSACLSAEKLSDMDVMCLENVAELCGQVEESCDVEDREAIINQLDVQLTEFHNDHIHLESFDRLKVLVQHDHQENDATKEK
jgi:chemotaxis methyl-accepting protein methylase